jgi:hypothetical protein
MQRTAAALAILLALPGAASAAALPVPGADAGAPSVRHGVQQDWETYVNGRQVRPYRGEERRPEPTYRPEYNSGTTNVIIQPQTTIIVPDTRSFNDKYGFSSKPR